MQESQTRCRNEPGRFRLLYFRVQQHLRQEPLRDLEVLLRDYKHAAKQAFAPIGTYKVHLLNELERLSEVVR